MRRNIILFFAVILAGSLQCTVAGGNSWEAAAASFVDKAMAAAGDAATAAQGAAEAVAGSDAMGDARAAAAAAVDWSKDAAAHGSGFAARAGKAASDATKDAAGAAKDAAFGAIDAATAGAAAAAAAQAIIDTITVRAMSLLGVSSPGQAMSLLGKWLLVAAAPAAVLFLMPGTVLALSAAVLYLAGPPTAYWLLADVLLPWLLLAPSHPYCFVCSLAAALLLHCFACHQVRRLGRGAVGLMRVHMPTVAALSVGAPDDEPAAAHALLLLRLEKLEKMQAETLALLKLHVGQKVTEDATKSKKIA